MVRQRTSSSGKFTFDGLLTGRYSVCASSDSSHGWLDDRQHDHPAGGPPVTLRLDVPKRLFGRVVDSTSGPVAHAWVSLFDIVEGDAMRGRSAVTTDGDGRFELTVASRRNYRVVAWPSAPDWRSISDAATLRALGESPDRVELHGITFADSPVAIRLPRANETGR